VNLKTFENLLQTMSENAAIIIIPGPTTATGGQPQMTITPDPGRDHMSRTQLRDCVRSVPVGARLRLPWRYGAMEEEEATETLER
jgi:hypothetical protein